MGRWRLLLLALLLLLLLALHVLHMPLLGGCLKLLDELHTASCTAGAVSFGKSSLCFFTRFPVVLVVVAAWPCPYRWCWWWP